MREGLRRHTFFRSTVEPGKIFEKAACLQQYPIAELVREFNCRVLFT